MDFTWALYIATLLALTGVQLHFIMLSPFIACYTEAFKEQELTIWGILDISWQRILVEPLR